MSSGLFQDLISRELWLGSVGSRDWIDRVRRYTNSVAAMSMVPFFGPFAMLPELMPSMKGGLRDWAR